MQIAQNASPVFQLNYAFYFQFHYSYSIDSRVNMASKMGKVLTLDECVKAIKLVESRKSSIKVAEEFGVEFGVGCTQIQEMLKYMYGK